MRAYLLDLAAEAAVRPGTRGTELESCGWYGLAHLHAHDKIGGVPLGGAAQYLMALCFGGSCSVGYAELGADPDELRQSVERALRPVWSGETTADSGDRAGEWAQVEKALGGDHAAVFATWRDRIACSLRRDAIAAVRAAAGPDFQILLHADPAPHRLGANVGVDPADVLAQADGVVLPCTGGKAARSAVLTPFAAHRTERTVLAANFTLVTGMGGSPSSLAEDAAHAASLGADEIRLCHAGLASGADLASVRAALTHLR